MRAATPHQRSERIRASVLAGAALVVAMHLGGAIALVSADDATVSIVDFAFEPASVTVAAGSVVTWTNGATRPHTVTSDATAFESGTIGAGEAFAHLFDKPGTFDYHCTIHPQMQGSVVVMAAAPTVAGGTSEPTPPPGTRPPELDSPSPAIAPETAGPSGSSDQNDAGAGSSNDLWLVLLVGAAAVVTLLLVIIAIGRRRAPSARS